MIYTLGWTREFAASHVIDKHPACGKLHGHTFRVRASVITDPGNEDVLQHELFLLQRLDELVGELKGRHLNDMLPAMTPDAAHVAAWFWERLALRFSLDEVTVWQDNLEVSLRHE